MGDNHSKNLVTSIVREFKDEENLYESDDLVKSTLEEQIENTQPVNQPWKPLGFVRYEEPKYVEDLKLNPIMNLSNEIFKHIKKLRKKLEKEDEFKRMQLESKNGLTSNLNFIIGHSNTEYIKAVSNSLNPTHLKTNVKALQKQKRFRILEPITEQLNLIKPNLSLNTLPIKRRVKPIAHESTLNLPKNLMTNSCANQIVNISFSRYTEQKKSLENNNFKKLLEKKKGELTTTNPSCSEEKLYTTKLPTITKKSSFSKNLSHTEGLVLHATKDEIENLIGHKTKIRYNTLKNPIRKRNEISASDNFNIEYLRFHNF